MIPIQLLAIKDSQAKEIETRMAVNGIPTLIDSPPIFIEPMRLSPVMWYTSTKINTTNKKDGNISLLENDRRKIGIIKASVFLLNVSTKATDFPPFLEALPPRWRSRYHTWSSRMSRFLQRSWNLLFCH